jgi:hypothetical protein
MGSIERVEPTTQLRGMLVRRMRIGRSKGMKMMRWV